MAKKKQTDPKAATLARIKRTEAYAEKIRKMFAETVNEILALNKTLPTLDTGVMFSFDDQSRKVRQQVEVLLRRLHSVATLAIQKGVTLEWEQANQECDKLVSSCFGKSLLSTPQMKAWAARNNAARQAFLGRTEKGLNLSQRVWKTVQQLREEMEVAMTVAIGEGESAASMSRSVRQYLNDPDLMFRRFRYKDPVTGEWKRKWKKRIIDPATGKHKWIDYDRDSYRTGAGIYKSSAKNAMRVTRTETNIAYRRADHERWQDMDFVLGQRVSLSGDHPKKDICDKLAGDYPKDFVFDGWHPQCFCIVTPITLPPEETADLTRIMLEGGDWRKALRDKVRGREIKTYPENFRNWVQDNAENIAAARDRGTEPYFIRNNAQAIDRILDPDASAQSDAKKTPLQIAEERHAARTPEQIADIKARAAARQERIAAEKKREAQITITANNVLATADRRGFTSLGISIEGLTEAVKKGNSAEIKEQTRLLALAMSAKQKVLKATAHNVSKVASDYGEVDTTELKAALASGNAAKISEATKAAGKSILEMKRRESAISDLIPNAHSLHQSYTMSELQEAYNELDRVMQKWLSKYGYSSLDAAPLLHLKNKLDFELTSPTISYSQKEIIKQAINEKIRLIEQKIAWNDLVAKATTLRTFKTKSAVFKNHLTLIDDAIRRNDFASLQRYIAEAERKQQELLEKQIKRGGDIKTALNKEYKGGAVGKDIASGVDTSTMTSEDPYRHTFTNNIARIQGFDAPAKLVSAEEFERLAQASGDVFFRTVNPTTFRGKSMSSKEFASQLYVADLLELNGPGGRVYGDGMYVATSAWDGDDVLPLSASRRQNAYDASICYGHGKHTISEMTWTRKPRIIKQEDLRRLWNKLSDREKARFGSHPNTYACALGYDGIYCQGVEYLVIFNRSIIAVKKQ